MQKLVRYDACITGAAIITAFSSILGVFIPLAMRRGIDSKGGFSITVGAALIGLFLGQALLVTLGSYLMARSGERQVEALRGRVTNHLLHVPMDFFDHEQSAELAAHIINDTDSIRIFFTNSLPAFVASIVTIVGSIAALFALDWRLSLTLLIALPLVIFIVIPLANATGGVAKKLQTTIGETTGSLGESFRQAELIKANTAEKETGHVAAGKFRELYRIALRSDLLDAITSPLVLMFLFGAVALVFTYGGQRVAAGTLTVGTLMSFLIYMFQLLNPLGGLSEFFAAKGRMNGATAKLQTFLATPVENDSGATTIPSGELALNTVSFAYTADTPVLSNVSLKAGPQQKIAIVGPSGGGKSTVIDLIERFYEPTAGSVTIAGQDAGQFDLVAWRDNIGLVSQNSAVVAGTVRDNLLFGTTKEYSSDQIGTALAAAGLTQDIAGLPQGLDTPVGEDGNLLSGGQKQRLQIARVYLKQPAFVIFDEATANLDADAESRVTEILKTVLENSAALVVAHRLSTIVDADVIYFLEDHQITGVGTHKELMQTHPTYQRFVEEQMIE
mgnify:CR=1 FL=1